MAYVLELGFIKLGSLGLQIMLNPWIEMRMTVCMLLTDLFSTIK